MGVYRIHNTADDRSLVGSSVNIEARLNRHRAELRFGTHPNRALQQDWNRLGQDAFVFETLDILPPPDAPGQDVSDDLAVLESLWLDRLAPYGLRGYHPDPDGV